MSRGASLNRGNRITGPIREILKLEGQPEEVDDRSYGGCPHGQCDYFEDFIGRLASLPDSVHGRTVATSGTPTINQETDTANGEVTMLLASTSEAEYAGLDWNDQRGVLPARLPVFQAFAKVSTIAANQRAVIGLVSDFNSTLDNTAINAWFRIDGSMVLKLEADDTVTDTDDLATSWTLTADTYYRFSIDLGATSGRATFYINGQYLSDLPFGSVPATTLQPVVGVQKDAGTGTPYVTLDYLRLWWSRL